MSDFDAGDSGYDGGHDSVDYGHVSAGQEHDALNQLHQAHGSEADYNNQFGTYENDHHADTSTDYAHGTHVEFDQAPAVHYEADDQTSYSHDASVDDHVFGAEGSENAHQGQFGELDALQSRFDTAFAEGTQFHGGEGHLGVASS
ncbi:hypothetical protein AB0M46_21075 [Dactylosporangium sp. NPDC051485]|uniref:hypothetical protein n=1 Tax=Dactylosporangium sp. NPDC051485 TaxID=3154846 RepID=UPI00342A5896